MSKKLLIYSLFIYLMFAFVSKVQADDYAFNPYECDPGADFFVKPTVSVSTFSPSQKKALSMIAGDNDALNDIPSDEPTGGVGLVDSEDTWAYSNGVLTSGGLYYKVERRIDYGADNVRIFYACENDLTDPWGDVDTDGDGIKNSDDPEWWNPSPSECADDPNNTLPTTLSYGDSHDNPQIIFDSNNRLIHQGCYYDYVDSTETTNPPPSGETYDSACYTHNFALSNEATTDPNSDISGLETGCNSSPDPTHLENCNLPTGDYEITNINGASSVDACQIQLLVGNTYDAATICSAASAEIGCLVNHNLNTANANCVNDSTETRTIDHGDGIFLVQAHVDGHEETDPNHPNLCNASSSVNAQATIDCSLPENESHEQCQQVADTTEGACAGDVSNEWCQDVVDNQQAIKDDTQGIETAANNIDNNLEDIKQELFDGNAAQEGILEDIKQEQLDGNAAQEGLLEDIKNNTESQSQGDPSLANDVNKPDISGSSTFEETLSDYMARLEAVPIIAALTSISFPSVTAACPTYTLSFSADLGIATWVVNENFDGYCTLIEQFKAQIAILMLFVYSMIGFWNILSW